MSELSDFQNNMAMVIEIDRRKAELFHQIAEQLQRLGDVIPSLLEPAMVFENTAKQLDEIRKSGEGSLMVYDTDGAIAEFLEQHELNMIWMEKVDGKRDTRRQGGDERSV